MGKLKKTALLLSGVLSTATVAVAAKNAVDVNKEEPKRETPSGFLLREPGVDRTEPCACRNSISCQIKTRISGVIYTGQTRQR